MPSYDFSADFYISQKSAEISFLFAAHLSTVFCSFTNLRKTINSAQIRQTHLLFSNYIFIYYSYRIVKQIMTHQFLMQRSEQPLNTVTQKFRFLMPQQSRRTLHRIKSFAQCGRNTASNSPTQKTSILTQSSTSSPYSRIRLLLNRSPNDF